MQYKPKIGNDFPITKDVILAKTGYLTEITRSAIALAVVVLGIVALLITAAICAYRGDFSGLQTFWAAVAAPLGCVIGYYFRSTGTNGQENHTSSA
jgi:hypothetical protein